MPIQGGIPEGIYDVMECMGELNLRYVGQPNMPQARFRALDLEGLFTERPYAAMTAEELEAMIAARGPLSTAQEITSAASFDSGRPKTW